MSDIYADNAIDILHRSSIGTGVTVDTKTLRAVMLQTGGDLTHVHEGYVTSAEIRKKLLGAGVYKIYLEKVKGEK